MSAAHRPKEWVRRALVCGALLAAAALGIPGQAYAAPADPPPDNQTLVVLLEQLQDLYQKAEQATETYVQAKVDLEENQSKAERLDRQLAEERTALSDARSLAGQLAREQYKSGGVSPYLSLLLSRDPQDAFTQGHVLDRAAGSQADLVAQLENGEKRIAALNRAQQHALDGSAQLEEKQREAKEDIERQLADVERILAGLTGSQIEDLQELEQQGIDRAQAAFLRSGRLGSSALAPSLAGNRALSFAYAQLGKPYVWGAEGPKAYDCSGLTSRAWEHAGTTIPRTSQEQWKQLPRVPLDQLRPGDLVVYFPGATHVAMYIGNGMVIQAPRPGAVVKISPIASNPVLGAVRPDSGAPSMTHYVSPPVPRSATDPTPLGTAPRP
ncbi:NlpC/P60 family protein [Actinacidiphila sp. bgisy167]|uniref:C40 family peptidase n=1 Tax=Actinacidiphila sp. bgisy167 TaxID=3413797 RepID=UPI003D755A64